MDNLRYGYARVGGYPTQAPIGISLWCLTDFLPQTDLRRFGQQIVGLGQKGLQMRLFQVGIQMGFAGPIFMEQELGRILFGLVQIVVEAAGIFPAGRDDRLQFLAQLDGFARLGLHAGDNSQRNGAHKGD